MAASSGYCWYFTLDVSSSIAPLHWALPSLRSIALRLLVGAASQSWEDSPWVSVTSLLTSSGPSPITDGYGNRNSRLSGLWGRIYTLEIPCRIRMNLPSPGLHLSSLYHPVSPIPFPDSPGSTTFINHFWILISGSASGILSMRKYWLSFQHLKWQTGVRARIRFLHE